MTGLRWSRRTTITISEELIALGISVSPNTVARLLHQMGYSLRVNHKQIATAVSPDRNLQFEYLSALRGHFQQRICPLSASTVIRHGSRLCTVFFARAAFR
jgi:Rhodopirellula transposase DDE domain